MKLVKKIFKSPIILVFALICVFLMPTAINMSSVAFRSAIALAIGIDQSDDGKIVLYTAINVPSTDDSLSENSKTIMSSGQTVGEAFANLRLMYGRAVKLGHTRFVLIGSKISQNNLTSLLDTLIRTNRLRKVVQLLYCPNDIGEMFSVGVKLNSQTGIKLSDIISHQQNASTTYINSNIDSFFKGFLSESKISKLNSVSLVSDATLGISPNVSESEKSNSSAQAGGEGVSEQSESKSGELQASNGSGSETEEKFVSNRGELAIFESGVLKTVLDEELSHGVNWLSKDYNPKELLVYVDGAEKIGNAYMGFDVLNKRINIESFFHKGMPFISAKIIVSLDLDEIISAGQNIEVDNDFVDDNIKSDIGRKIRSQISEAVKVSKNLKLDIFELNDIFHQNNYKEYNEYIKQGKNIYDIIEDTQISAEVEIKII